MKHKHWVILGYNKMNDIGNYIEPIEISIEESPTEKYALMQAKRLVKREFYVARSVRECSQCNLLKSAEKFFNNETKQDDEI